VTGSDDARSGSDTFRGDEEPTFHTGLCPRCGRALADDVCLHCAGDGEFRGAALVRKFVNFPDLYAKDTPSASRPGHRHDEWPARGAGLPDPAPDPAEEKDLAPPARSRERAETAPKVRPAVRPRHLLDAAGWGSRGILAKVVIATGSVLLATGIGIVGAVVTAPASTRTSPGVEATPSVAHSSGRSPVHASPDIDPPRPSAVAPAGAPPPWPVPTRAVTGAVTQGAFCLHHSGSGTSDASPVEMRQCDNTDAQRWTFATDGTVRVFGKCLRPVGGASAYDTKLELWDCDGTASQQWLRGLDDSVVHPASGACLENPPSGDAAGSRPRLGVCGNGPGQRWNLPGAVRAT
jgi:hypothetical protein